MASNEQLVESAVPCVNMANIIRMLVLSCPNLLERPRRGDDTALSSNSCSDHHPSLELGLSSGWNVIDRKSEL